MKKNYYNWFKAKKYKIYEGEYIVPDVDFQSFLRTPSPELPKSFIEKIFDNYDPIQMYQENFNKMKKVTTFSTLRTRRNFNGF